jgi:hypothetical protein
MRALAWTAVAVCAAVLAACEADSTQTDPPYSYGYYDGCRQYASCGTCTPVLGCGWCFDSDGTGECVSTPAACSTPVFSWTWNPSGCRVPADAQAGSPPSAIDAGAPTVGDDAGEADASATPETGTAVDSGTTATDAASDAADPHLTAPPVP